jgi:hypothetical protein
MEKRRATRPPQYESGWTKVFAERALVVQSERKRYSCRIINGNADSDAPNAVAAHVSGGSVGLDIKHHREQSCSRKTDGHTDKRCPNPNIFAPARALADRKTLEHHRTPTPPSTQNSAKDERPDDSGHHRVTDNHACRSQDEELEETI